MKIDIKQANETDKNDIWEVLCAAVEYGNTCVYSYDMSYGAILENWLQPSHDVFVAVNEADKIIGTFYLKQFEVGLASHVVTGDFIAYHEDKNRGVLRLMVQAAIETAIKQGYSAMYLKVIQHNRHALRTFNQLGFQVTGSIPRAYKSTQGRLLAFVLLIRTLR